MPLFLLPASGFDSFDLDLEGFSVGLHDDLLALGRTLGDDHESFIPTYLAVGKGNQ